MGQLGTAVKRQYNLMKNIRNWWIYHARKMHLPSGEPMVFVTRAGISVRVPGQVYPEFKSIFMKEHYMEGLGLPVGERPVVVDVGANLGFFSFFAASRFRGARIFSYEPIPRNFEEMERNVRSNPGMDVNCRRMAVSGISGTIELSYEGDDDFPTTATTIPSGRKTGRTEKVKAVTLAEVLKEEGLNRIDLLKMDCEGSEFSILYQSSHDTLERVSQMALEVHSRSNSGENTDSLSKFLISHGFKVRTNKKGTYLWAWRT
jgi:FkbM family methyltransferase